MGHLFLLSPDSGRPTTSHTVHGNYVRMPIRSRCILRNGRHDACEGSRSTPERLLDRLMKTPDKGCVAGSGRVSHVRGISWIMTPLVLPRVMTLFTLLWNLSWNTVALLGHPQGRVSSSTLPRAARTREKSRRVDGSQPCPQRATRLARYAHRRMPRVKDRPGNTAKG